ncbi:MAG: RNase adapter RapZ [Roseinatronobacter sp.]
MPQIPLPHLVLVTGPAGSGRTTVLQALEDLGFEAIDNIPASLLPRLVTEPLSRHLAVSIDARNRDFNAQSMCAVVDNCAALPGLETDLLYLDCQGAALIRRFSETRRRHAILPDAPVRDGIAFETDLLASLRARADILIDTTEMSPHDLRADIHRRFGPVAPARPLTVQIVSFSYKRGLPEGADIVFDCRFLRNPHWDDDPRPLDGRNAHVAEYVEHDPAFALFFDQIRALVEGLLRSCIREGKAHLSVAFGCSGTRHRSVATAEKLTRALASGRWRVSKRHWEREQLAQSLPDALMLDRVCV